MCRRYICNEEPLSFFHHKEGVIALAVFRDRTPIAKGDNPVHLAGSFLAADETETSARLSFTQT